MFQWKKKPCTVMASNEIFIGCHVVVKPSSLEGPCVQLLDECDTSEAHKTVFPIFFLLKKESV